MARKRLDRSNQRVLLQTVFPHVIAARVTLKIIKANIVNGATIFITEATNAVQRAEAATSADAAAAAFSDCFSKYCKVRDLRLGDERGITTVDRRLEMGERGITTVDRRLEMGERDITHKQYAITAAVIAAETARVVADIVSAAVLQQKIYAVEKFVKYAHAAAESAKQVAYDIYNAQKIKNALYFDGIDHGNNFLSNFKLIEKANFVSISSDDYDRLRVYISWYSMFYSALADIIDVKLSRLSLDQLFDIPCVFIMFKEQQDQQHTASRNVDELAADGGSSSHESNVTSRM